MMNFLKVCLILVITLNAPSCKGTHNPTKDSLEAQNIAHPQVTGFQRFQALETRPLEAVPLPRPQGASIPDPYEEYWQFIQTEISEGVIRKCLRKFQEIWGVEAVAPPHLVHPPFSSFRENYIQICCDHMAKILKIVRDLNQEHQVLEHRSGGLQTAKMKDIEEEEELYKGILESAKKRINLVKTYTGCDEDLRIELRK